MDISNRVRSPDPSPRLIETGRLKSKSNFSSAAQGLANHLHSALLPLRKPFSRLFNAWTQKNPPRQKIQEIQETASPEFTKHHLAHEIAGSLKTLASEMKDLDTGAHEAEQEHDAQRIDSLVGEIETNRNPEGTSKIERFKSSSNF